MAAYGEEPAVWFPVLEPKLKVKGVGAAIPTSRTDQNGPSGTSATRENLLQSGAHSGKSIVLSP